MNSDDRLRQAFEDLERRSDAVDPRYSLQRLGGDGRRRNPWMPALAGAAAVLAVIGVVAVSGLLSGPDTDDVVGTTVPDATTLVPDSTTTSVGEPITTTTIPGAGPTDIPTHQVTGVAEDDVLNVRAEPGPGAALIAVLPPDYAGIRALDNIEVVADGGSWRQVELLDPTRVVDGGELDGMRLVGWVNTAFITEYDPTLPEIAPCQHDIGPMPEPTGDAPTTSIRFASSGLEDACARSSPSVRTSTPGTGRSTESPPTSALPASRR
ncbi:MAG: hypothetical protein ACLGHX_08540 [Acidimicrobiia bacterium]